MITKLTEEQRSRFPEFVEKWTRIGLCTDPADRQQAERGVNLAYQIAGLKPPEKIIWCESPFSQGLTRAIVLGQPETNVGDYVWASIKDSVWDSVVYSVVTSIVASVRASVRASVMDSVRDSVSDSVWASVRASVSDSVRGSGWASIKDSVMGSVFGQHEADWMSFYDYIRVALGLDEQTQKLAGLWQVSQSAGWWVPHEKICWISERHNVVNRNAEGRLHFENGPAIAYPDGWKIWAINGSIVDEQIVMQPHTQTIDQIHGEANGDIRSIRIERFGWPRYLRESNAHCVAVRDNEVEGTKEALYRSENGSRLLVTCPTGRVFALGVPDEIADCQSAQNWLNGNRGFRVIART